MCRMKRADASISAGLMVLAALWACGGENEDARVRAEIDADTVRVAAAWSWDGAGGPSYAAGIQLAVEEVNHGGGIGGIPLAVHRFEDHASVHEGRLLAQQLASDPRYSVVIGHLHSHVTLAAATIYEASGRVMITPGSTVPELTRKGYRFVFRTVNSDAVTAQQLVAEVRRAGHRRVALCYVRSDYGSGLANAFERSAVDEGIEIVDRRSYDAAEPQQHRYEDLFTDWRERRIDAVMLAGTTPSAAHLIRAMRSTGLTQPVFGGDALDDGRMIAEGRDAIQRLRVMSVFHPDNERDEVRRFVGSFTQSNGIAPDSWAARGYEAVRIAAEAMRRATVSDAISIADVLRHTKEWPTLLSFEGFDSRGDPVSRPGILIEAAPSGFRFEAEVALDAAARSEAYSGSVPSVSVSVSENDHAHHFRPKK